MDPYKVLGVSPGASQDEIKKKYRELVKQYHPDKVRGTPQEAAYEEKLKQINKAYDMLTKGDTGSSGNRGGFRGGYGGGYGYSGGYTGGYSGQSTYTGEYAQQFARVRQCIETGNLQTAESFLDSIPLHNAEWHYLKGVILMQRGWYDGARQHFANAYQMEPNNQEYATAYSQTSSGYTNFYGRGGMDSSSEDCCRLCTCMMCLNTCCDMRFCC